MNHNHTLNVDPQASAEEIQAAFRKAALETHPDHSDSPEAAEAFARIKQERDKLMKNAESRHDSDQTINAATSNAISAATKAAFSTQQSSPITDPYYGFSPEEITYIQKLDRMASQKPKRSLRMRNNEPDEVRRHRHKLHTGEDRLNSKY